MEDLRERVEAVERALTDGDGDLTALAEGAATAERVESLEAQLETLREDVAELEAATQALRGYVGNVRSVNESVEEQAEAALAAVESLENRLPDEQPASVDETAPGPREPPDTGTAADTRETVAEPDESPQCQTCGQPVRGSPAADGGRAARDWSSRSARAGGGPAPEAGGGGRRSHSTGSRDLDGFDPDADGFRVPVSRDSSTPAAGGAGQHRQTDESGTGSLLGRLRDRL